MSSFKKKKSPSVNGWIVEIYLGFYELVEEYLLRIVEESRTFGEVMGARNSTFIALIPKKISWASFEFFIHI